MQFITKFGKVFLAIILVASLASCGGGSGGGATAASTTTITGSAGDGPVTGGNVSVRDANNTLVTTTPANPTTGTNAQFNFTVPSGTALPLTITVTGGTDTVTGATQDFPLRTAVTTLPASGTVTGNANPLSTLAVASAEAQAGGLTAANLTTATNNVLGAVGFGLAAGVNPLSTTVDNTNAASIVRANEAAAELIRRAANASGGTLANTITSIAQDLTDGVVDGATAAGATATQVSAANASHILNQQAQVSAETLANNLTVTTPAGAPIAAASGANFATTLNTSITTTGHTGNVSQVAPTQAFLDQTRTAINIANTLTGGGNANLNNLLGGINTLTAGNVVLGPQQTSLAGLTAAATFPTPANIITNAAAAAAAATAAAADTTAPVAPAITAPAAGLTNINTPTVSGTAEAGALVTVLNGLTSVGTATANGAGAWTLTSTVLTDGAHTLTATATDAAGNTGVASAGITITVDTTAPVAPTIGTPTTASLVNSTASVAISGAAGSAEAGSTVTVKDGATTLGTATAAADGSWTLASGALAAGAHSFAATATDTAGNTSAASTSVTYTIDTIAPVIPTISAPVSFTLVNSTASVTISGAAGSAEAGSTVTVKDGATALGTATAAADGSWALASGVLAAGAHSFNATATDAAGNTSAASRSVTYTIDTTAPVAPTVSTPTTGTLVNSTASVAIAGVAGSAEAGATVTVKDGATTLGTATAAANGSWTFASGILTAAVHNFTASQTDLAGNTGPASAAVTYTVDTTAPIAPTVSTPAAGATVTTNTPTVSGSAEANATINLFSGTTTLTNVGTTTANGAGAWTMTSGALVNGTHTLTATATDAAGNVSASSATPHAITVNSNPIITGAAVDGYVSGAILTVFSDLALTTQIGTGTTNAGGQFSIQLTAATVPDPMYIRSVGGTDIDTGMPAPTMMFTVSGSPSTGLNITPMTNAVYGRVQDGQSLNAAQVGLLTDLGLASNAGLYGNPVVTASLQANMFKALTSGTMGATLAAGNYQMFVMTAGEDQLAGGGGQITGVTSITTLIDPAKGLFIGPINFNVAANGNVSGTFTAGAVTMSITGKVQGSSIIFNIINPNANPALPPISITRMVGTIGLNASVSGNFTDISGLDQLPPAPVMTKGVFVGSFIPATGVNPTGLATFVNNFYSPGASGATPSGTGLMNIVARDILLAPGSTVPRVTWGQAAVTAIDVAAGTVTMTHMPMNQDAGSVAGAAPFTATFIAGQYVKSGTTPTNILIFEYSIPTGEKLYIVTAVGLRRGIYLIVPTAGPAAGMLGVIGESYMSKASGLVPGLTAGTTYDITVASINAGMPGQSRAQALGIGTVFAQPESIGPMPIPAAPFNAQNGSIDTTNGAPELIVFQGSVMAMKQDTNDNFADNQFSGGVTNDHIRVVEFFESGAMMGEEISGGTFTPPGGLLPAITMRDFPSTFVGFFHPTGSASPSFTGSLNILARTVYSNDFSLFMDAYVTGSLAITLAPTTTVAGTATMNVVDPNGTVITGNLTIDAIGAKHGVYHIHGADSGGSYTDIFWPIGSKKATYIVSTGTAGTGTISEVGEAYITQ